MVRESGLPFSCCRQGDRFGARCSSIDSYGANLQIRKESFKYFVALHKKTRQP
jgi:hypothetical protein